MRLRTGLMILAVAVVAAWVLPSLRSESLRVAHEFLMSPPAKVAVATRAAVEPVQPVQLALLVQTHSR